MFGKYRRRKMFRAIVFTLSLSVMAVFSGHSLAGSVIDEWDSVIIPARPDLKQVTVDPKSTALLLLDFNKQTCNPERRPRCIESIPVVKSFYDMARAHGMTVVYSLSAGAAALDIAKEFAPLKGDRIVTSGPDKFLNTDLEKILKGKKITTVIITGTAAHGAVLHTAAGAAFRGFNVIIPVDGLSAESLYAEQYTVWHLLNAPRVSAKTTLTSMKRMSIEIAKLNR